MSTVYEGKRPGRVRGSGATSDGAVTINNWQSGHAGQSEVWDIDTDAATGTVRLAYKLLPNGDWDHSDPFVVTADAATVETALDGFSIVSGVTVAGTAGAWTATFAGDEGPGELKIEGATLRTASDQLATSTTTLDTVGIAAATGYTSIVVEGDTNTFTLSYGGQTTGALDESDNAAALEVALELLSTITAVTVTGSGAQKDPFQVLWVTPAVQTALTATLGTFAHTVVDADRA